MLMQIRRDSFVCLTRRYASDRPTEGHAIAYGEIRFLSFFDFSQVASFSIIKYNLALVTFFAYVTNVLTTLLSKNDSLVIAG